MNRSYVPVVLLLIFAVSGFSGLIYESIWSHYLKLFLGHAAYSQVLVLAIFMGGMAIGAAVAGRFSVRWRHVLLGYAAVEAITGVIALLFHGAFDSITRVSFASIIPSLESVTAVHLYKWSLGAAVILPQSILLGMTFPLMSAGFLRFAPGKAGQSVAMLYFTNSLGGAIGVLASGFLLIPNVGLPGAIMTAGLLNLLVAMATWLLVRTVPESPVPVPNASEQRNGGRRIAGYRLLLIASLITGMASFCYEIGWLRMLSLVLGASTHAFELMLSAFILGLALGGLWIRRGIERNTDPVTTLAIIQMAMGLLALSTLYVYGQAFDWMGMVVMMFSPTDAGYGGFNWASHLIASAVMVPTTFCAGMTLPLVTYAALRAGVGERALGAVYAANTLGAILGIALAVHVLMPLMNSKGVIIVGALLDFGLGIALLNSTPSALRQRRLAIAAVTGLIAFSWASLAADIDPKKAISGVFRYGNPRTTADAVIYLRDGKTAAVSLARTGTLVYLATNGKTDASINMGKGPLSEDEETQALIAALPVLISPSAKTAAMIGLGSGMSTHVMLAEPGLERVDTIEIEARMIEAARLGFYPRNQRAYEDPRSVIHVEDAKTFFSVSRTTYDIIVSEPSNPWVSGVSSLFTQEFYRHMVSHLSEGGVLAQWVQLYEIDFASVASILKALSPFFSDYAIYITNETNILIVARNGGAIGDIDDATYLRPAMRADLQAAGIASADEIRARRIGTKELLDPYFNRSSAPLNSDYFPFIDHQAPKARFKKSRAPELVQLLAIDLPIPEMLSDRKSEYRIRGVLSEKNPTDRKLAQRVIRDVIAGTNSQDLGRMRGDVIVWLLGSGNCGAQAPEQWENAWKRTARFAARYLDESNSQKFWNKLVPPNCRARFSARSQDWYGLYGALATQDPQSLLKHARRLLQYHDSTMPIMDTVHVVAAAMLAHLALGEPAEALAAHRSLAGQLPPAFQMPLEVQWLEAIAKSRAPKG
jgi:spermidine synthase